ncbi:MAG: T9SS type A sorting domain-containing protein [Bacteroidetes bacterium]|nr:T9SS type A sorting domain-containing protein [Bacteroidota bacterium]
MKNPSNQDRARQACWLVLCWLLTTALAHGQITLPPGMAADAAYAPFLHGVASGDPTITNVMLWTRITTESPTELLSWEVAEDSLFEVTVLSGTAEAKAANDWTVHVDAGPLDPGKTYYYRFTYPTEQRSRTGRTKTLPLATDHIRLAVASCSSVYSGYFNAYGQLAKRDDLQAVIHLGDYIYDFVDEDEEVRVPTPYPAVPVNLEEWRTRHAYYLLDPDLRALRAAHPLLPIWDNHDLETSDALSLAGAIQAFREWLPLRPVPGPDANKIYRRFAFGQLATLHLLDIQLFSETDLLPSGEPSLLGNSQFEWLRNGLDSSSASWQLIGNQKLVSPWRLDDVPAGVDIGSGNVLDSSSWDGYNQSRQLLMQAIADYCPGQALILSGDAHMTVVTDLPANLLAPPLDTISYDSETGAGSLAAEFLPSSISRGNADEMGLPPLIIAELIRISREINPHQQHLELTQHGFGLLDIRADSIVAESWYAPILERSAALTFGGGWVLRQGTGHWERQTRSAPVGLNQTLDFTAAIHALHLSDVYPNPAKDKATLEVTSHKPGLLTFEVRSIASGKMVLNWTELHAGFNPAKVHFDTHTLASGSYTITVRNAETNKSKYFVIH